MPLTSSPAAISLVFAFFQKAATAPVDARVGVPLTGLGMVVGQALDHAPHRARPQLALQRRVRSRLVRKVGLPGLLVFRGTTSVVTVHHRGKDDTSPDKDERLEQSREEPPHRIPDKGKSAFRGVCWNKGNKKWQAEIQKDRKMASRLTWAAVGEVVC